MTALVGCVLSYALLVPGALSAMDTPPPGALCAVAMGSELFLNDGFGEAAAACPMNAAAESHGAPSVGGMAGTTTTYSNPIDVNCSGPEGRGAATAIDNQGEKADWFRGCDPRAFDFRYRVSRFADSERQNGVLVPQRERRTGRSSTLATGLPSRSGTLLSLAPAPLALYAVVGLVPPLPVRTDVQDQRPASTRVLEPLERPPRA